jgi:hypothetical protein
MDMVKKDLSNSTMQKQVFLPTGAIWLAIFALLLEIVAITSCLMEWRKVSPRFPGQPKSIPIATHERLVVTFTNEMSGGEIHTAQAILWMAFPALGFGFLLKLISSVLPHRAWRYIIIAIGLYLLFFIIAACCPSECWT